MYVWHVSTCWLLLIDIQDALPAPGVDNIPHCYLPLLIWLDKTEVADGVKMHPIILRALWLPSLIRNASGNAGGVLLGYMPVVSGVNFALRILESLSLTFLVIYTRGLLQLRDELNPSGEGPTNEDFTLFKMQVYHKVLAQIFDGFEGKSHNGVLVKFADAIFRIGHPGVLIISLDAEEAPIFNACKSHNARLPCPRCLVTHDELDQLGCRFTLRTVGDMRSIILNMRASSLNRVAQNTVLTQNGLRNVEVCVIFGLSSSVPIVLAALPMEICAFRPIPRYTI